VSGRELAVIGAIKHFRAFLIGKDPGRIGAIWQELYRGQYFEGGRVLTGAISAIDIALWDIAGKRFGVPVYELLGGKQRNVIPCFPTSRAPMGEALIDDAKKLIERGWRVVRATICEPDALEGSVEYEPHRSIAKAAACLTALREAVGHEIVLGIDMHHRLSVAQAASFCQKMPQGTLDFLEEPIRHQTPGAYQALRAMTDVPFAVGEECASKWDFLPYLEKGLTNFARIDVCNVGGLTEALKIAALAEAHYIDVMPHDPLGPVCTAATIHLCAGIPNVAWCEIAPYGTDKSDHDRLFVNRPIEKGGVYALPTAPGLGVDVREELIKDAAFKFWEIPRRHKPDGSFTNW
ncbi:MAG: mandelate racemase/muconate lactonizing enzyme family protein, partial [Alphaproteobacteria bacterium]